MISAIECGNALPGLVTLATLSRALHFEPSEILEFIDVPVSVPLDLTGVSLDQMFCKAESLFWAGDYRSSLATYDAMLERLRLEPHEDPSENLRLHARTHLNRATCLRRCGALSAARTAAERAISDSNDDTIKAEAWTLLASLMVQQGSPAIANAFADLAISITEDLGPKVQAWGKMVKGEALNASGRFADAASAFEGALTLAREAGDTYHIAHIEGDIAACLLGMGKTAEAKMQLVRAIETARGYGVSAVEASWLVLLGRLALDAGNIDEAEAHARSALLIAKPKNQLLTVFRAEWLRHLAIIRRDPGSRDRQRLSYLRKIYEYVKDHQGVEDLREFREAVLNTKRSS